jgi:subtilisin family serine protease
MRKIMAVAALTALVPSFVFARTPNDASYDDLWYLPQISAPEAWDVTTGDHDVVVAVLDTGVSFDHPDLEANIWVNSGETANNGKDDDHNGFIDDISGWDFVDDDNTPEPVLEGSSDPDAQSHGTFVAGIVGAVGNNRIGYAGIAWNVSIMPIRILDKEGSGNEADAADAIRYAVQNGADVINLSFVGDESNRDLRSAVQEAYRSNVVVVAALGNDARNVNKDPVYPACLQSSAADWVIGVTASDRHDEQANFTNYGADCADIAAPGDDIHGLGYTEDGSEASDSELYIGPWSGTSMASPIVAGAAALLRSAYPDISVENVRLALEAGVDPAFSTSGLGALGAGRVNLAAALEAAGELVDAEPETTAEETTDNSTEDEETNAEDISEDDTGDTEDFSDIHDSYIALGTRAGSEPWVHVWRADGVDYASFLAFGASFTGGVQVAIDDLNDDNAVEVVATPGPGGGPQVRVFTVSGALVNDFFAYDEASRQGVSVALGDVTGDGVEEIVTAVGAGVSNDVVMFNQDGEELSRFTVNGFQEGTRFTVSVADVDKDWEKEIIVAAQNKEPRVAIYNEDGTHLVDFLAYAQNMDAGLTLSSGDFDGDARDEIVIGPLTGGAGHVRIFNYIGALWGEFFITEVTDGGGTNVSVADMNIDGEWDIVTAPHGHEGSVGVWTPTGTLMGQLENIVPAEGTWMAAW